MIKEPNELLGLKILQLRARKTLTQKYRAKREQHTDPNETPGGRVLAELHRFVDLQRECGRPAGEISRDENRRAELADARANASTIPAAMPREASGKVTKSQTRSGPAPEIIATSSSERPTASKRTRLTRTSNGKDITAAASTTAFQVKTTSTFHRSCRKLPIAPRRPKNQTRRCAPPGRTGASAIISRSMPQSARAYAGNQLAFREDKAMAERRASFFWNCASPSLSSASPRD